MILHLLSGILTEYMYSPPQRFLILGLKKWGKERDKTREKNEKKVRLHCKTFYAQQQQHNWNHQQTQMICFLLTSAEESRVHVWLN